MTDTTSDLNAKGRTDMGTRLMKVHIQIGSMGTDDVPNVLNYLIALTNEMMNVPKKELLSTPLDLSMVIQNIVNRCTMLIGGLQEEDLHLLGPILSVSALFGDFCKLYFRRTRSSKVFSAVSKCMDYVQELREKTGDDGLRPLQTPNKATLDLSSRACLAIYFLAQVFNVDTIPYLMSYTNTLKESSVIIISELVHFAPLALLSNGSVSPITTLLNSLIAVHSIRAASKCLLDLIAHYERSIDIQLRTDPISGCLTGVMNQYDSLYGGLNALCQTFVNSDNMLAPTKQMPSIIPAEDLIVSASTIGQMLMIIGISNTDLRDLANIGVGLLYACFNLETFRLMRLANYVIFLPQAILSAAATQESYLNMNNLPQPAPSDGKDKMREYRENVKKYERSFKAIEKLRLSSSDAEKIRKNVLHLLEVSWVNAAKIMSSVFVYVKSQEANNNINSTSAIQGISLGLSASSMLGVTNIGTVVHNHWSLLGLMVSRVIELVFMAQGYSRSLASILRGKNETLGTYFDKYTLTKTYPTKYTDGVSVTYQATQRGNARGAEDDINRLINNVVFFGSQSIFQNMAKNLTLFGMPNKESNALEQMMGCYSERFVSKTLSNLSDDGMLIVSIKDDWLKGKFSRTDTNPFLTDFVRQMDNVVVKTSGSQDSMHSLSMSFSAYFLKWVSSCAELVSSGGVLLAPSQSALLADGDVGEKGNGGGSNSGDSTATKTRGTLFDEFNSFILSIINSTKLTTPVPFVSSVYAYISRFGMVPSITSPIIKVLSRSHHVTEAIELLFKFGRSAMRSVGVKDMEKENEGMDGKDKQLGQGLGKGDADLDYTMSDSTQKSLHRIGLRKISIVPTHVRVSMALQLIRYAINGLNKTEKEPSIKIIKGCLICLLEMPIDGRTPIDQTKQLSTSTLQTLVGVMKALSKSNALTKELFSGGTECISLLSKYLYKCTQAVKDIKADGQEKGQQQQQQRKKTKKSKGGKRVQDNKKNADEEDGFNFDLSDDRELGEVGQVDKNSSELLTNMKKFTEVIALTPFQYLLNEFNTATKELKLVLVAPLLTASQYETNGPMELIRLFKDVSTELEFIPVELRQLILMESGERDTIEPSNTPVNVTYSTVRDVLKHIPRVVGALTNPHSTPQSIRAGISDANSIIQFLVNKCPSPVSSLKQSQSNAQGGLTLVPLNQLNSNFFNRLALCRSNDITKALFICSFVFSEVQASASSTLVEAFAHLVHCSIPIDGLPLYVGALSSANPAGDPSVGFYLKILLNDALEVTAKRLEEEFLLNPGDNLRVKDSLESRSLNTKVSAFVTAARIALEFSSKNTTRILPFVSHAYSIINKALALLKENGIEPLAVDIDKVQLALLSHTIMMTRTSTGTSVSELNAVSVIDVNNLLINGDTNTEDRNDKPLYLPSAYQTFSVPPHLLRHMIRFSSLSPLAMSLLDGVGRTAVSASLYLQRSCLWNSVYTGHMAATNHPHANSSIVLFDCLIRTATVGKVFDKAKNTQTLSVAAEVPELQRILSDDYNTRLTLLNGATGAGSSDPISTKILCVGIADHPFCPLNDIALQCVWEQMFIDSSQASMDELLETISLGAQITDAVKSPHGESKRTDAEKLLRDLLASVVTRPTVNIIVLAQFLLDAFKKGKARPLVTSYDQAEVASFPRILTEYPFVIQNSVGAGQKKQQNKYGDEGGGARGDSESENSDAAPTNKGAKRGRNRREVIQTEEEKHGDLFDNVRIDVSGVTELMEQLTSIALTELITRLSEDSQKSKMSVFANLASLPTSKAQALIASIFSSLLTTELTGDVCKAMNIILCFSRGVGDPGDETFNLLEEEFTGATSFLKDGLTHSNVHLANDAIQLLLEMCRWDTCCRSDRLLRSTASEVISFIGAAGNRLLEGICRGMVDILHDAIFDHNEHSDDTEATQYTHWLISELFTNCPWVPEATIEHAKHFYELPGTTNEGRKVNCYRNHESVLSKQTLTEFFAHVTLYGERGIAPSIWNSSSLLCAVATYNIYSFSVGASQDKETYTASLVLLKNILEDVVDTEERTGKAINGHSRVVRGITKLALAQQPTTATDREGLRMNEARGELLQALMNYVNVEEHDTEDPPELVAEDEAEPVVTWERTAQIPAVTEFNATAGNEAVAFDATFETGGVFKANDTEEDPFGDFGDDPFKTEEVKGQTTDAGEKKQEVEAWDDFGDWGDDGAQLENNQEVTQQDTSSLSTAMKIKLDTARHSDFVTLVSMYNEEQEKAKGSDSNFSELLFAQVVERVDGMGSTLRSGTQSNARGFNTMEAPVVCAETLKTLKQIEQGVKKSKKSLLLQNKDAGATLNAKLLALVDEELEYTTSILWFFQAKKNRPTDTIGQEMIIQDSFTRNNLPKDVTGSMGEIVGVRQLYDDCISAIHHTVVLMDTLTTCSNETYNKLLKRFGLLSDIDSSDLEQAAMTLASLNTVASSAPGTAAQATTDGFNASNTADANGGDWGDEWGATGDDGGAEAAGWEEVGETKNEGGDAGWGTDEGWGATGNDGGFATEGGEENVAQGPNSEGEDAISPETEANKEGEGEEAEEEEKKEESNTDSKTDKTPSPTAATQQQHQQGERAYDIDEDDINDFFGEEVFISSKSKEPSPRTSNRLEGFGGGFENDPFGVVDEDDEFGLGGHDSHSGMNNTTNNNNNSRKDTTEEQLVSLNNGKVNNIPLSIVLSLLSLTNVTKHMESTTQQLLSLSLIMVRVCGFTSKPEHIPLVLLAYERIGKTQEMVSRQGPQLSDKVAVSVTTAIERASTCFAVEHKATGHNTNPLVVLTVLEAFLPICVRHEMDNYDNEETFDPSELAVEFCKSVLAAYPAVGRIYAERSPTNTLYVQAALSSEDNSQPKKAFFAK